MYKATCLYRISLLLKHPSSILKRFLYLVVSLSTAAACSLLYVIPAVDQYAFFSKGTLSSIALIQDESAKRPMAASISVYSVISASTETNELTGVTQLKNFSDGVLLFDVSSASGNALNLWESNMNSGVSPSKIKSGEAVISYNLARKLDIPLGSTISIIDPNSFDDYRNVIATKYTVAGISHTQYANNERLGLSGTGIILTKLEDNPLPPGSKDYAGTYLFYDEELCGIEGETVWSRTEGLSELTTNMIRVEPAVAVMSFFALLLVAIVAYREFVHENERGRAGAETLLLLGESNSTILKALLAEQLILVTFASLTGSALLLWLYFNAYLGFEPSFRTYCITAALMATAGAVATYIAYRKTKHAR